MNELISKSEQPGFWEDQNIANEVNAQISTLKKTITSYSDLKERIELCLTLIDDVQSLTEINKEIDIISANLKELKINSLLNGPYDINNCYLEIHPGAGGTESCDWAGMIMRMYERYFEKNEFLTEIIDLQKGDEAGIKSVTILVKKPYAYGLLKREQGVHRLVRISPFDSNRRRHTSFASVSVIPEINNDSTIIINDNDLKIDVYHSGGAGGQSVNTTDSAVRITHLPSKIVVTCQNERSQLKNKEKALQILRSKLKQQEIAKQEQELAGFKGDQMSINFGSQIRSYVLEPYSLIKDHRSNVETSNVDKVLDGEINEFIEGNLLVIGE